MEKVASTGLVFFACHGIGGLPAWHVFGVPRDTVLHASIQQNTALAVRRLRNPCNPARSAIESQGPGCRPFTCLSSRHLLRTRMRSAVLGILWGQGAFR